MLHLRDYQRECVDSVREAWGSAMLRPASVLPTGAGKTVAFAQLIGEEAPARGRALVLAHRDELISQAVADIRTQVPRLRVGVLKARMDQVGADVVVASVQTLRNAKRRHSLRNVGMIIVDECHHSAAPSYRTILDHYGAFGPSEASQHRRAVAAGFTATMVRGDGAGLGAVWESVVYERDIRWMITRGYLVAPRGIRVRVEDLNLAKVKKSHGDFAEGALGAALGASLAPERIVDAWIEHAKGRPTLLFAPTVAFGQKMAATFNEAGVSAGAVWGEQPIEQRRQVLADFAAGRITVVCNCMVLTEGTNLPLTSCIVIARPTSHAGLYTQMVGRGLRLYPGKADCLVLDVVGASKRHGLASLTDLLGERDPEDGEPIGERDELDTDGADERDDEPEVYADGTLVSEEVDLFHGSRSMWLRTQAGFWFLAAGGRFIALIRNQHDPATFDVLALHRYDIGRSSWVARAMPDLGYAMAHGEEDVTDAERLTSERAARWRDRGVSNAQRGLARRYNIDIPPLASSGDASNLITIAEASRRIDTRVPSHLLA